MEEEKTESTSAETTTPPNNTNPLGITDELREALLRAGQEQLNYQIPVDLDQCSEEEKTQW